jgi:hypothetical protein
MVQGKFEHSGPNQGSIHQMVKCLLSLSLLLMPENSKLLC